MHFLEYHCSKEIPERKVNLENCYHGHSVLLQWVFDNKFELVCVNNFFAHMQLLEELIQSTNIKIATDYFFSRMANV